MTGTLNIHTGVSESDQQGSFQNATLQGLGERQAISIAVTVPGPLSFDPDATPEAIRTFLHDSFGALVARGFDVEIQIGPSVDFEEDA